MGVSGASTLLGGLSLDYHLERVTRYLNFRNRKFLIYPTEKFGG